MGKPRINMKMTIPKVNLARIGLILGQLSTRAVIKDSTTQNWESIPRMKSMKKNNRAHKSEGASLPTTFKKRLEFRFDFFSKSSSYFGVDQEG